MGKLGRLECAHFPRSPQMEIAQANLREAANPDDGEQLARNKANWTDRVYPMEALNG